MMKMNGGPGGHPMEMMREMMGKSTAATGAEGLLTPELTQLFEEWVAQLENEILENNSGTAGLQIETIMKQLGLSKESTIYLVARLATRDKVKLTVST